LENDFLKLAHTVVYLANALLALIHHVYEALNAHASIVLFHLFLLLVAHI
jgi:hypothetical protein